MVHLKLPSYLKTCFTRGLMYCHMNPQFKYSDAFVFCKAFVICNFYISSYNNYKFPFPLNRSR